jgi:hypothetical protein
MIKYILLYFIVSPVTLLNIMVIQYSATATAKKLTTASSSSGSRRRIDNSVYWSIIWRAITPRVGRVLPPLRRLSVSQD